ncbi:hypothetical protein DIPPA_52535 [Diplonema papillatum]|nr:hypothetical protein DIPPA_52535 [Diplonema papillatum]
MTPTGRISPAGAESLDEDGDRMEDAANSGRGNDSIIAAELEKSRARMRGAGNQAEVFDRFKSQYAGLQSRETLGPLTERDVAALEPQLDSPPATSRGLVAGLTGGRRAKQQVAQIRQIHSSLPTLTLLMVVRIQRTWRGYTTRKTLEMVKRHGCISDLGSRRVIESAIYYGRHPVDIPGMRHLPMGIFAAVATYHPDTSPYRVRLRDFILRFAILQGGCSGFGLFLIFCLHIVCTLLLFLIPGWVAMTLKTIFYDGESTLQVDQLVSWVGIFSLLVSLAVGGLHSSLVGEQDRFVSKIDFVLAVIGLKKKHLIRSEQLLDFRHNDLGVAARALYIDGPVCLLHGLHIVLSLCMVLILDWQLGCINLGCVLLAGLLLFLYDKLVLAQMHLVQSVGRREGALQDFLRRKRITDKECTSRNYQLGIAKMNLRMNSTFSRIHTLVGATVLMLMFAGVIFFFYNGGKRVQGEHITVHSFVLAFCYFVFTQISFFKFNERFVAFFLARTNMSRLMKLVWHFRDFSDQQTFHDRECSIIAHADNMKEFRRQPRSCDLFFVVAFIVILVFVWLFAFALGNGDFKCTDVQVSCNMMTDTQDIRNIWTVPMEFGFNFFFACSPISPLSSTLRTCALVTSGRVALVDGDTITPQIAFEGWRKTIRGVSKRYQLTAGAFCPTSNLQVNPYRREEQLNPKSESHHVGYGTANGLDFNSMESVFFESNNMRGCFDPQPIP